MVGPDPLDCISSNSHRTFPCNCTVALGILHGPKVSIGWPSEKIMSYSKFILHYPHKQFYTICIVFLVANEVNYCTIAFGKLPTVEIDFAFL